MHVRKVSSHNDYDDGGVITAMLMRMLLLLLIMLIMMVLMPTPMMMMILISSRMYGIITTLENMDIKAVCLLLLLTTVLEVICQTIAGLKLTVTKEILDK
ncbi:hypothetical protein DPMN_188917, partial [Dreissena polymorpha]